MHKNRARMIVSLLAAAGLTACGQGTVPQELASFSGRVEVSSGRIVIDSFAAVGSDGRPVRINPSRAIEVRAFGTIPVEQDGNPGASTAPDVVELVASNVGAGLGPCERDNSFCADVTLRSFFAGHEIRGAFVELTSLSPAMGNNAYGDFPPTAPALLALGLDTSRGLWDYGNIDPNGTSTRTWNFDNYSGTDFHFSGRVLGDLVPDGNGIEIACMDGVDNDEDGARDCYDPDCSDTTDCNGGIEICANGHDDDGDGLVDCADIANCGSDYACLSRILYFVDTEADDMPADALCQFVMNQLPMTQATDWINFTSAGTVSSPGAYCSNQALDLLSAYLPSCLGAGPSSVSTLGFEQWFFNGAGWLGPSFSNLPHLFGVANELGIPDQYAWQIASGTGFPPSVLLPGAPDNREMFLGGYPNYSMGPGVVLIHLGADRLTACGF